MYLMVFWSDMTNEHGATYMEDFPDSIDRLELMEIFYNENDKNVKAIERTTNETLDWGIGRPYDTRWHETYDDIMFDDFCWRAMEITEYGLPHVTEMLEHPDLWMDFIEKGWLRDWF